MTQLPFFIRFGVLDPAFSGTPQEFADAMVERMSIVGPSGFYGIVLSDTEPTSNIGMWLAPGLNGSRRPYVWDPDTSRYVPLDVSESIAQQILEIAQLMGRSAAGRIIFSPYSAPPGEAERTNVLWIPTTVSPGAQPTAYGVYAWNGTKWARVAGAAPSYIVTSGTSTEYTGDAGDPDVVSLADVYGRLFVFSAHTTCGDSPSFRYASYLPLPMVRADGTAIVAGEIVTGMVFVATLGLDNQWRVLTPLKQLVVPALTLSKIVADLPVASTTVTHGFPRVPLVTRVVLIPKEDYAGFIKGVEIDASRFVADYAQGNSEEGPLVGYSNTDTIIRIVVVPSKYQVIVVSDSGVEVRDTAFDLTKFAMKVYAFA